jgi:uncharacterized protein with beta-barrel porin domain
MTTHSTLARTSRVLLCGTAALAFLPAAVAQETIDGDRTTPVLTSATGDLTIGGDGSVTVDNGTAVTVDSDATVVMNGTVEVGTADGATGVLVSGTDLAFGYTQTGLIDLSDDATTDDETPPDFANDRFGFRIAAGSYTGNVVFGDASQIVLAGDSSAAFAMEGDLTGNIEFDGDIDLDGEGSVGMELTGDLDGDFTFGPAATISVVGENSDGLRLMGDITGAAYLNGSISITGFQDTAPDADTDANNNNDEQAALVSGDAFVVAGNVGGGVLLDGALPRGFSGAESEAPRNTQITVRGSGRAMVIDGGATPATIGLVDTAALDDPEEGLDYGDWGVINRGALLANGLYAGVEAQTVYIANADIAGGIRNDGTIDATAGQAMARALVIGSGTTTPRLLNDGRISAAAIGTGSSSIALSVEAGANIMELINNNRIETLVVDNDNDAVAIRDASGSITSFTNAGVVSATVRATGETDDEDEPIVTPNGDAIAIDFSANTSGVTITNTVPDDFDEIGVPRTEFGQITGDVLTGTGNDLFIADAGRIAGNLFLDAGNDEVQIASGAQLVGNVDFGLGNGILGLDDAILAGDLTFGAGTHVMSLANGAVFSGGLVNDGTLDITVADSSFLLSGTAPSFVSSLTATGASSLGFRVSEDGSAVARLNADLVSLADGTEISTLFTGAFAQDVNAVIISAGTLDVDLDQLAFNAEGESPILFEQTLSLGGAGNNDLILNLRRRSADELGLSDALAPAYEPAVVALTNDQALGSALFNVTTRDGFQDAFNQVLAGPLDAPLAYARAQNNSVTSIIAQRVDNLQKTPSLPRTVWLQEETYFLDRGEDEASNGFDGGGFVVALGVDTPVAGLDVLGVSAHLASARYDEQLGEDFPFDRLSYGVDVYAAEDFGAVEVDGRVGYAISDSQSERNVVFGDERRQVMGEWEGTQLTANGRVRYRFERDTLDVVPFVSLDYVSLDEDAYTETGDATLALDVADREAQSMRLNAGVTIGKSFEIAPSAYDTTIPGTITPRLTAGWSQELITDDYEATYNFAGGDPFTLTSEPESGAGILGADIEYENQYAKVHVGGSGQFGETTNVLMLRIGIGLKW